MRYRLLAIGLISASVLGFGQTKIDLTPKTPTALTVTSEDFRDGTRIPSKNSASGGNASPRLNWSTVPAKTKSVALLVDDPDANGFVHWILYNVSPETNQLQSGLPRSDRLNVIGSAMQGRNGTGGLGYFGPKPPPGKAHHYQFKVYALDIMLPIKPGASKVEVERAMSGHVLSKGELVGLFTTR
jgi:Raf kinase inhibitor-like YbhB/YbcL family protein